MRRGARLVQVQTGDHGLTAFFSDGTQADGDVLIGADGINSTLRGIIDPLATPSRYVGQRIFYGYSAETGCTPTPTASTSSAATPPSATSSPSTTAPGGSPGSPTAS